MASEDLFQEVNNSESIFDRDQEFVEERVEDKIEESVPKKNEIEGDKNPSCSEQHVVEILSNESSDIDVTNTNEEKNEETVKSTSGDMENKLTQLPMGRVRNLMKLDSDLRLASNESIFAVTRAAELFIASLAREAYVHTAQSKKKTISKRDVDLAISTVDSLMFLDGAMNF